MKMKMYQTSDLSMFLNSFSKSAPLPPLLRHKLIGSVFSLPGFSSLMQDYFPPIPEISENEKSRENANIEEKDNEIAAVHLEQVSCSFGICDPVNTCIHVNGSRCFGLSSTELYANIPSISVWDVSSKTLPNPLWVLDPQKPHSSRIEKRERKAKMKEEVRQIGGELMLQLEEEWLKNLLNDLVAKSRASNVWELLGTNCGNKPQ